MEKKNSNMVIIPHGRRRLACCTKTGFGEGALLTLVSFTLVLGAASASFSAPAVGSPYYLECKVYVMSNSQDFTIAASGYYFMIFRPFFDDGTNMIKYNQLGLFYTNKELIYYPPSQIPMGKIYFWAESQKRWKVWQELNHNYPLRKSEFHAFEAGASNWAGAVLPFGSDPNEIFPNGCSDLSSQQPDQPTNPDTGKPECNNQDL